MGGVAGEQFALPEAVEQMRKHRDRPSADAWSVISAVDPLNLIGVLTRDTRVPAVRGNRIVLLNGRAIAAREAKVIRWLVDADDVTRRTAERLLTAPGAIRREVFANRNLGSLADASGFFPGARTRGLGISDGRKVVTEPVQ